MRFWFASMLRLTVVCLGWLSFVSPRRMGRCTRRGHSAARVVGACTGSPEFASQRLSDGLEKGRARAGGLCLGALLPPVHHLLAFIVALSLAVPATFALDLFSMLPEKGDRVANRRLKRDEVAVWVETKGTTETKIATQRFAMLQPASDQSFQLGQVDVALQRIAWSEVGNHD